MAQTYAYAYAEIDNATGMCVGMHTSSDPNAGGHTDGTTTLILIDEYNEDYIFKYYLNGSWYEDAEGTIPWSPN